MALWCLSLPCAASLFTFHRVNIWLGNLYMSNKFRLKSSSKFIFVMDPKRTLNFEEIQIQVFICVSWLHSSYSLKQRCLAAVSWSRVQCCPGFLSDTLYYEQILIISELCSEIFFNSDWTLWWKYLFSKFCFTFNMNWKGRQVQWKEQIVRKACRVAHSEETSHQDDSYW